MKKWAKIMIIAISSLFLTSCIEIAPGEPFAWPDATNEQNPFYGETLTVAVFSWEWLATRFADEYKWNNPGTTVEVIYFEDLDIAREQISLMFMAGNAPTLIMGQLVDYLNPMTARNFSDWLPIMYADPRFDEDDWFMNIFYALSRDGSLIGFPMSYDMSIGNSYYVVNSSIPGLAEEFAKRQSISINEMMDIYNRISPTLDRTMYMERSFDVLQAVEDNIDRFFDFETRRVEFSSSEFISFINHARETTSPRRNFGTPQFFSFNEIGNRQVTTLLEQQYFFRRITTLDIDNFGAFEENLTFVNPLPYTNDYGELLISPDFTWILSSGASHTQQAMALDFLRFMMVPPIYREDEITRHNLITFSGNYSSPVRRHASSTFTFLFSWAPSAFQFTDGWRWAGEGWHEAIETVAIYTEVTGEMPMRDARYAPEAVRSVIREILHQFHDGLITAEQAANDLQNRVLLIIMEMG